MENTIEAFVDKLIKDKGVSGLSPDVMDQMKSDLVERADDMVNAEILLHMPQEALADFEKKLDEGNDDEIQKFCEAHIKNLDEVVAEALIKLQKTYLAGSFA